MPSGGGGGGVLPKLLGLGAVGTGLVYAGGSSCLINVEGGHRAVMYHRFGGVQQAVMAEGTHIIVPWFMKPIIYDVRAKPRMIQSMTGSKGAQHCCSCARRRTRHLSPTRAKPGRQRHWQEALLPRAHRR